MILSDKTFLKLKIVSLVKSRYFLIEKYDILLYLYIQDFCLKNLNLGLVITNSVFLLNIYLKFYIFLDYLSTWDVQAYASLKRSEIFIFLEFLGIFGFGLTD